jgi:SAM-dependent methyltransferase
MPTVKPYRWLAEYYDRIFAPARGPFVAARRRILRRVMSQVRSACDLACGTGDTAVELAAAGIRVYAVDDSAGMCRATREKTRTCVPKVRVIHSDMRAFSLPEPVDLVTCECDALNHIPRRGDLRAVARSVGRALRPGGHFFFDVNNVAGFESYWRGDLWLEAPGVVAVLRSRHRGNRAWSDVEWFLRDGAAWRRRSERLEEVCWTAEEIERTFQRAGFDRVEAFDAAPSLNHADVRPGCRTFYLARRVE